LISNFYATTESLARTLSIDRVIALYELNSENAIFDWQDDQLVLHCLLDNKTDILKFDLAQGEVAIRANKVSKSNEVIAKAIGCKSHYRPKVLDATAGMGRDSLMMAMLGCDVIMQERNFAIYHLLANALQRLKDSPNFNSSFIQNIVLQKQDSISSLFTDENIDVVYLDPMFPERKKTALVKKEMRLFKLIAGEDLDADQLFLNAIKSGAKRVVVKRPKGAPLLANKKPSHEIRAKKFRYDVYLT